MKIRIKGPTRKLIYIFLIVICSFILLFKTLPQYLIFNQTPKKSNVIIVTSGDGDGSRLDYGINLYKLGFATKIILTGGPFYKDLTWAEYKKNFLKGVVPDKDIILEKESTSTLEEAKNTLRILKKRKFKSIILITNEFHSRRAYNTFRKVYKISKIQVISCPVKAKGIDIKIWWKDNYYTEIFFLEIIKTVWYMLRHGVF